MLMMSLMGLVPMVDLASYSRLPQVLSPVRVIERLAGDIIFMATAVVYLAAAVKHLPGLLKTAIALPGGTFLGRPIPAKLTELP